MTKGYDSHCNLVLGDVEETIYTIEEDEDGEETVKVLYLPRECEARTDLSAQTQKKQSEMLFVRGRSY